MVKVTLILLALMLPLGAARGKLQGQSPVKPQPQPSQSAAAVVPDIKVTIKTVSYLLGSVTDHYKVGEQIPVTIVMTNNTAKPLYICTSTDLYQNLPKLTKDGAELPYMKWQSYERLNAQRNHTCEDVDLPEPVLLRPQEPTAADWFVLVDSATPSGAEAWYNPLTPGKYELSIQRRFECCDGPMVQSNTISFEVAP
jgi:hypothetical protein